MHNLRLYPFILLITLLGACSHEKEQEQKASSAPTQEQPEKAAKAASAPAMSKEDEKMAELMKAIFAEKYRTATNDALAELTDPDNREEVDTYVLNPVAMKYTSANEDEAVLIANAQQADADGNAVSAHASSGLLNVYFLRKYQGRWEVLKNFENIATLGSFGNIGEVVWVILAPGKPGFGVIHGGTWQGYTISTLSLFDLNIEDVKDVTGESINIASENEGACGPDTDVCWNVDSKWKFVPSTANAIYNDIEVEFFGEQNTLSQDKKEKDSDNPPRITKKVNATARYAFDGKHYQLVKGENVVPTF